MLNAAIKKGPQLVTRRGVEVAVLVPIQMWNRLQESGRPGLKAWLLTPEPRFENIVPKRGSLRGRRPLKF